MYALTVDLDENALKKYYPAPDWRKAYDDIGVFLADYGFTRRQGSVYFGGETVDAVVCVTTVQDLGGQYPWLEKCVRDMRMLRIEEFNDLLPAIKKI